MRDYNLCYPAILINTLVPQPGLSSILQNQLGVALDALTLTPAPKSHKAVFTNFLLMEQGIVGIHGSPSFLGTPSLKV